LKKLSIWTWTKIINQSATRFLRSKFILTKSVTTSKPTRFESKIAFFVEMNSDHFRVHLCVGLYPYVSQILSWTPWPGALIYICHENLEDFELSITPSHVINSTSLSVDVKFLLIRLTTCGQSGSGIKLILERHFIIFTSSYQNPYRLYWIVMKFMNKPKFWSTTISNQKIKIIIIKSFFSRFLNRTRRQRNHIYVDASGRVTWWDVLARILICFFRIRVIQSQPIQGVMTYSTYDMSISNGRFPQKTQKNKLKKKLFP